MSNSENSNSPRHSPFLILRPHPHTVANVLITSKAAVVAVETAVDFDPDATYFDVVYDSNCQGMADRAAWTLSAMRAAEILASGKSSPQRGFFSKDDFQIIGQIFHEGTDWVIQIGSVQASEAQSAKSPP